MLLGRMTITSPCGLGGNTFIGHFSTSKKWTIRVPRRGRMTSHAPPPCGDVALLAKQSRSQCNQQQVRTSPCMTPIHQSVSEARNKKNRVSESGDRWIRATIFLDSPFLECIGMHEDCVVCCNNFASNGNVFLDKPFPEFGGVSRGIWEITTRLEVLGFSRRGIRM